MSGRHWPALLLLLPGACVPVNRAFRPAPGGVPVYVASNGWHTDLLLPLREPRTGLDWRAWLGLPPGAGPPGGDEYVAFGWGNAAFYLAYRGGGRPGAGQALRALLPGSTVMHVEVRRQPPRPGPRTAAVQLSVAQYRQLAAYVQQSFARDSAGRLHPYPGPGLAAEDFFFAGTGRYHALRTCNSWTNAGLKQAGCRAAWQPLLAAPVLRQVRRAGQ